MKCINNFKKISCLLLVSVFLLTGCGSQKNFLIPYDADNYSCGIGGEETMSVADTFAHELCINNENTNDKNIDISNTEVAGLFDLSNKKVICAQNLHKQMNPASLTKIMTALLALEQSSLDEVITVSANAVIEESGAQLCGLKEGDTLTMDQALYCLLLYSGNDAGVVIAEHIAGSVEEFSDKMNERAAQLGATNTHFSNPHGLTATDHYTTAYDLYLIFNEVMKYDKFIEIVHSTEYSSVYHDKDGNEKSLNFVTTNLFFNADSDYHAPDGITVIGGKTGTTEAAGACLILLSNDAAGNPYISIILKADDKSVLYTRMANLLSAITG